MSVIPNQPKKIVNLHHILWSLPLKDGVNLGWIYWNPFLGNYIAQKLHYGHPKVSFLLLSKQLVLSQSPENDLQVSGMLLPGLGIDQDVINEHHNESVHIRSENLVHEVHKRHWCIHQSKWHHQKLKVTIPSFECGLEIILLLNLQLMISRP